MDVTNNTIEKLLSDESFLAWYFKTDPLATEKWNKSIASDPVQRKLVDEAVQVLQNITIKEQPVDVQRLKNAEARLMNATVDIDGHQSLPPVVSIRPQKYKWWAVAAIIFLTSLGVWQYYSHTSGKLILQTAYGETRQSVLPDGSQVMLNANTTLNYRNWREGSDREVWVKGEAFFHVKKTAQKTKFIVHTGNFDVVVTGTQFNVISRNNKNNVLLKEGSVTVQHNGQQLNMKPGDYIEFNNTGIQKKAINNAPVLAWTEHKFMFDNTPMKEVASLVTELYGIKVTLADDSCAAGTISGIILNDNLDVFVQAVDALPEYEVIKLEDEILIRKK
ncbi:FecR family protein [Niastella sp. OAS944]|uniref:FecR family protein n=1 Tax=Niastella sp. OAS944 TaxID=2664089 RepID=UPI00346D1E34|nr:ferric-dicitrate binding protein FerR (iron transport regulator) [Chitinophagaceae bacterium OAS944]